MRRLLVKDLQILKRSPLLVGLLVVYPIVIALMIGFALSSPPGKPKVALLPALRQLVSFATLAIDGLAFASPTLSSIGTPLTVQTTELTGKTTPTSSYAAAIAVIVSLFVHLDWGRFPLRPSRLAALPSRPSVWPSAVLRARSPPPR
jgi:hypothetical protein